MRRRAGVGLAVTAGPAMIVVLVILEMLLALVAGDCRLRPHLRGVRVPAGAAGGVVVLSVVVRLVVPVIVRLSVVVAARAGAGAARRRFLLTRSQTLRTVQPRQEALVHRRSLPKVTQSLNSL
ncbi:hypothetical protein PUN4_80003 [Paraburkholderia unamae]|nr:hypothetical protein PUN4_80003 [Paraburkholderia unamae]